VVKLRVKKINVLQFGIEGVRRKENRCKFGSFVHLLWSPVATPTLPFKLMQSRNDVISDRAPFARLIS